MEREKQNECAYNDGFVSKPSLVESKKDANNDVFCKIAININFYEYH